MNIKDLVEANKHNMIHDKLTANKSSVKIINK